MSWALVRRHLHHQRALLLALALGLVGFEVLIIQVSASFSDGPGLQAVLELIPGFLQRLMKTQLKDLSFPAIVAFGFQHPAVLVALFGQVLLCGTLVAADHESGALEVLLARPVPRRHHMLAALACVVLVALLLPLCMLVGTALGLSQIQLPDEKPWTAYAPCTLGLSALLLAAGGLTLWIAAPLRRRGTAVTRMLALLVGMYLLELLAQLWAPLGPARWASLFHYSQPISNLLGAGAPVRDGLVLLGVFAISTLAALRSFERQDL